MRISAVFHSRAKLTPRIFALVMGAANPPRLPRLHKLFGGEELCGCEVRTVWKDGDVAAGLLRANR